MEIEGIKRKEFPYFVKNSEDVYLDSASTTQKPEKVINEVKSYLENASNIGRGEYKLASENTRKVDNARKKVADFINCNKNEIVFTSGATDSFNKIAYAWGLENLQDGDKIILGRKDHSSLREPWYNLKKMLKNHKDIDIVIEEFGVLSTGDPEPKKILEKVDEDTKLVVLTHVHNKYGTRTEIENIVPELPEHVKVCLDSCQSIGHIPVDVKKLGVDFLGFSGHKMFANTGIGVLYVREEVQDSFAVWRKGGGQKGESSIKDKLEAGTPNISGIISLNAAIDFIKGIGIEKIAEHQLKLNQYALERLSNLENIEFLPGMYYTECEEEYGPISFKIKNVSSKEVGMILDQSNILVRTGSHCAGSEESVRISTHIYNNKEDIEKLYSTLELL